MNSSTVPPAPQREPAQQPQREPAQDSQREPSQAPRTPRQEPERAQRPGRAHPLRIFSTVLHLAVLGTAGWALIGSLFTVLGTGVALLFVLGVGLVLLVGLVYAFFGVAWFETARVNGLYNLDVAQLPFERPVAGSGFGGWIRSLGRQLKSGRMWWALADFVLASVLGAVMIPIVQGFVWSIGILVAPDSARPWTVLGWLFPLTELSGDQARIIGAVGIVLAVAAVFGLALLHRTLSIAIVGSQAREAALTAEAHRSAERARQSADQREGAVRAADVERSRIERDLHDGVQPRLVSVGMTLGLAQQTIDQDPEAAKALVSEAHTSTKAAITELRQLARGIHASVLDDRGLDAALSALASRSHIPVSLDVRMNGRVDRDAESAVYFVIAESLTNAAKHSRASECRVTVRVRESAGSGTNGSDPQQAIPQQEQQTPAQQTDGTPALWARVEDNGIGGARVQPGGGLDGISNRVRAAGGAIRIDSPHGGPTAVEVSVPCAS